MGKYKWNLEKVSKLMNEQGCKLLSTKYIRNTSPLLIQDENGYIGRVSLNNFQKGRRFKLFKLNYNDKILKHNIKTYFKNSENSMPNILDVFKKDERIWVKYECVICGRTAERQVWKMLDSPYCKYCGLSDHQKLSKKEVEVRFNRQGYKVLRNDYKKNTTPLLVEDKDGYYGHLSLCNLNNGLGFKPFRIVNNDKWVVEHNMKRFAELQNVDLNLIGIKNRQGRLWLKTTCANCGQPIWRSWEKFKSTPIPQYCKSCNPHRSPLEILTESFLNDNKITYIPEYRQKQYRFDFYLPDYKILIEVDDKYHFNNDTKVKNRDNAKNNISKELGLKLIRIPYWEYPDNFKDIILDALNK